MWQKKNTLLRSCAIMVYVIRMSWRWMLSNTKVSLILVRYLNFVDVFPDSEMLKKERWVTILHVHTKRVANIRNNFRMLSCNVNCRQRVYLVNVLEYCLQTWHMTNPQLLFQHCNQGISRKYHYQQPAAIEAAGVQPSCGVQYLSKLANEGSVLEAECPLIRQWNW